MSKSSSKSQFDSHDSQQVSRPTGNGNGSGPGQLMLRARTAAAAAAAAAAAQTKIIQSRFLHIYGLLCLGTLMACIKAIGASIAQQTLAEADADAQDKDKDKKREAETETKGETEADAEADARIMATGICIIRLITLKRFLENSKTDTHNQRRQQSATSATSATSPPSAPGATGPRRRHLHYPGHPAAHPAGHPGHPEACTLLMLLLLTSLWPDCCDCLHGGSNTVKTKYGLLRGIVVRSSPLVEAFLGIPYASPPVGSLRFMPPITPSTWKTVRSADRFSPVCPQNIPIPPNGPEALLEVPRARLAQLRRLLPLLKNQSEDCLYLNIYVPYETRRQRRNIDDTAGDSKTKLSTVVFIHGESYDWNSGNPYDGSELAAHGNVIVVTINFRLGIFGFLKTGGKESAQGNFGLMDLVAGLHWLKENLPAFGGDPQSITLLGYGTGAVLANILVVSPVASDLIQRTVLVSGSALSPWAIQKNPLFVKRRVAEQTGCHGDMLYDDLAPCLRTKSVAELLAVKVDHPRFLVGFAPFVDGTVISPGANPLGSTTLPMGSAIVSTSGIEYANFPKRDLIFCLTSVESYLDLSAQDLEFGFNETRRDRILRTFVRNNFHYHLNEIFAVLKNEYTDWEKAIRNPLSSRDATLQFLSDGHTASPLIKLGYMHSLRGGRAYFLHFKHKTIEEEYPQRTGSVRGEDVPFWLGLPMSPLFPHNYTTQERQIGRLMLRYLSNFAKTGNPNQSTAKSVLPNPNEVLEAELHQQKKRSTGLTHPNLSEALNLAVIYNQRRTNAMHEKRSYIRRRLRSNDAAFTQLGISSERDVGSYDGDELPFWDAYDVVNQLYVELGNKANIQSHYRGHKLSMWLNLIPQLHRHFNINDQSMRHHQFQDDMNNRDLYEGVVRPQLQTKPAEDDNIIIMQRSRTTPPPPPAPPAKSPSTNATQALNPTGTGATTTTECGIDGAMSVSELTTTQAPKDNRTGVTRVETQKDLATASTGLIGNLELLRRLGGKQFQSYTTALIATVAVGCFLLILNVLIFAGIYHQREKRARDAKTKEELQESDNSKNSSMLKLNALMGGSGGGAGGPGPGDIADAYTLSGSVVDSKGGVGVVFGEYSCYDEKTKQLKEEKLLVELPPSSSTGQTSLMMDTWGPCSTSTLDLLKTKPGDPIEMVTYSTLPTLMESTSAMSSKRGSFVDTTMQFNSPQQFDYAVQSSDQMSFKAIEEAVKAAAGNDSEITRDDDIPEPPPPPRSFLAAQQQQQQQTGILRQSGAGGSSTTGSGSSSGKKRVHIQEISV
ncbi:neuroligin-4, X-linked [Drosophila subpulchrella]|uniref:neuroligin-4, X-linked n=1 Tax=Drosophila subpulchrella TaxID=1486046 RepID=UPI0018A15EAC|nr:neuroligin-4, X-linked [Drosophila subpulchrella]XP_037710044.1 neuroligin-4, X-linked [Drosophila subpulchrella]